MKSRAAAGLVTAVFLSIVCTLAVFGMGADRSASYEGSGTRDVAYTGVNGDNYYNYLPAMLRQRPCESAPNLMLPANGSQLNTLIPLFTWNNGNDPAVTTLRLQVATDPNMQDWIWSLWSSGPTTGIKEYLDSDNFDPARTYYWQAWLECDDVESPHSEIWSFTTGSGGVILPGPNLIAPGNQTVLPSLPQTFEWSAVGGAVEYIIHWRTLGRGGYTYGRTDKTSYEINWLESAEIHEWWVTARNEYAYGNDSAYWLFKSPTTVSAEPSARNRAGGYVEIRQNGDQEIRTFVEDD